MGQTESIRELYREVDPTLEDVVDTSQRVFYNLTTDTLGQEIDRQYSVGLQAQYLGLLTSLLIDRGSISAADLNLLLKGILSDRQPRVTSIH